MNKGNYGYPQVQNKLTRVSGSTITISMSASITLTNASTQQQIITPTTYGLSVNLPNCNDFTNTYIGADVFVIVNNGVFPVEIKDSVGTLIGWARAGDRISVDLVSIAAATGGYVLHSGDPELDDGIGKHGVVGLFRSSPNDPGSSSILPKACMFADSSYGVLFYRGEVTTGSSTFSTFAVGFQVTNTGFIWSSTRTDVGTAMMAAIDVFSALEVVALSATQIAIVCAPAAGAAVYTALCNIGAAASVTPTFAGWVPFGQGGDDATPNLCRVNNTNFLISYYHNASGKAKYATATATSISFGAFAVVLTNPTAVTGMAVLSPTLFHFMGAGQFNRATLAGTTLTPGTPTSLAGRVSVKNGCKSMVGVSATKSIGVHKGSANPNKAYAVVVTDGSPSVSVVETLMAPDGTDSGDSSNTNEQQCMYQAYAVSTIKNGSLLASFQQRVYNSNSSMGVESFSIKLSYKNDALVYGAPIRGFFSSSVMDMKNAVKGSAHNRYEIISADSGMGIAMAVSGNFAYETSALNHLIYLQPVVVA